MIGRTGKWRIMTAQQQKKMLLAASTGGHLAQLVRLAPDLGAAPDSLWVTFRTPQSESLLRGKRVHYVPYVRPRDYVGAMRAAAHVRRLIRRESFDQAVSTGAALAVSALPFAWLRGIPTLYIESVSRVNGPSASGRILAVLRCAELRTQHPNWAGGRWRTHESVLSTYSVGVREPIESPRLFVTLGTIEGYRFDSLVDAVLDSGLADDRTVWQLGYTHRTDLPGDVSRFVSADEFAKHVRDADVVISHAGVGTILQLLDSGVFPVLATRRRDRNEHVDDHQAQIADMVNRLGVGIASETPELDAATIIEASARFIDNGASARGRQTEGTPIR